MRKDQGSPQALTCIKCGVSTETDEDRGKLFEMAGQVVYVCHDHVAAFALGVEWQTKEIRFKQERMRKEVEDTQQQQKQQSVQSQQIQQLNEQRRQQETQEQAMQERRERVEARMSKIFNFDDTPQDIYDDLSRWVVGQDAAKRTLSSAVRNHYKRVQMRMVEETGKRPLVNPDMLMKESTLLLGPTGCGKSHICRTLATKIIDVPYHQQSATNFSEVGYVGGDVLDMLSAVISAADGYCPLAFKAAVFVDELDKKAKRDVHGSRDVSGEGVQTQLLELLDVGTKVFVCPTVAGRRNPNQPLVEFDTTDVMFILGGAFVGLSSIISNRLGSSKRKMGFGSTKADEPIDAKLREAEVLHEVLPEDLIQFGMIPELVGRMGCLAVFDPLTKSDLRSIMLDIEDAVVKQQRSRAAVENFNLEFTDEAIDAICKAAVTSGMGARRLRSLTTQTTAAVFFEVPSRISGRKRKAKVTITAETVADPTKYEFK